MFRPAKRKLLTCVSIIAACTVLFATYWFTRPPELVWWRSPEVGSARSCVRLLVPTGWEYKVRVYPPIFIRDGFVDQFTVVPVDHRPFLLRKLFPVKSEMGGITIDVFTAKPEAQIDGIATISGPGIDMLGISSTASNPTNKLYAEVSYQRENKSAFNRTYKQICDSLTIE